MYSPPGIRKNIKSLPTPVSRSDKVADLQKHLTIVEVPPKTFESAGYPAVFKNPTKAFSLGGAEGPGSILSLDGNVANILIRNFDRLKPGDTVETVLAHIKKFQQQEGFLLPMEIYLDTGDEKKNADSIRSFSSELVKGINELYSTNYAYEIENSDERYIKLKLQQCKRNIWPGWESQFNQVAPKTAIIAKLGMSFVDFLRDRTGVEVRIGGSLSAAMFGGQREPRDIDIDIPRGVKVKDIPNNQTEGEEEPAPRMIGEIVEAQFKKLPGKVLTAGKDLFVIESLSKTRTGVNVKYWHKETTRPLDPLEDNDEKEIKAIRKEMKQSPTEEVNVDFSPEEMFDWSGLIVDSEGDRYGYYGPEFLLAAYLNRLVSNLADSKIDAKDDRGQIKSLLSRFLSDFLKQRSGQETSIEEKKNFLLELKNSVLGKYVKEDGKIKIEKNAKKEDESLIARELMNKLYDEIISEVSL